MAKRSRAKKVVESTVVETPVVETPVVETPVVETPVVETPTVEETATAIAESAKPKKERAKRVSNVPKKDLIEAVVAGSIAGKTNEEVAKELGMHVKSFESRLSTVRKQCKNPKPPQKPFDVPYLVHKNGGAKGKSVLNDDFIEKMKSMLAKASEQTESTESAESAETESTASE